MGLGGYRSEGIVLVLVAVAALSTVDLAGPQDRTRVELTRHVVLHGTLTLEPTLFDRATFARRSYSDKAPGMSFLAVPVFAAERAAGVARAPTDWRLEGDLSLWSMRVLTSGALFVLGVLLIGRVAERLVAGTGALTAATFGTGTLAAPLAPTFFEHDAAAALAFAGFVLVWIAHGRRSRLVAAGLCEGLAIVFQYEAALAAAILAIYCGWPHVRRLGWLTLGALPPLVALGAYDLAAFGSPFHLSYRYVTNRFAERQHTGFFGIGIPTVHGVREVLVGNLGLLVLSPVVAAAGVGLVLLWLRGRRREAFVAAAVAVAFVVADAAYFLPYGGNSPGPRFLAPGLPFLLLGLPAALARFPRSTVLLAAVSIVATTVDSATWSMRPPGDSSWLPHRDEVAKTVWTWVGVDRNVGAVLILAAALGALAVGVRALRAIAPVEADA